MPVCGTVLSHQEKKWLIEQRITRLTDNKEVLIYPMGAERYLSQVLLGNKKNRYDVKEDIKDKTILVIPGYGNSAFLFAEAGAKSVTVYDKDPVTIAWVKAFKKYYHYRMYPGNSTSNNLKNPSIGELLIALTCWYPPLITLPTGQFNNRIAWLLNPKALRRTYIFYMMSLVGHALQSRNKGNFELASDITFYAQEINHLTQSKKKFDTAYVPYLLGVKNGIEQTNDVVDFTQQLMKIVPHGHILISPARNTREFYFTGQQYFITTGHPTLQAITELSKYFEKEDKYWFKTQGLSVFKAK